MSFILRTPNINNKMKFFKSSAFRLGLILAFLSGTTNANAQFFKKLGKAIQKAANTIEEITQPTNEPTTRTMKIYKQPDSIQADSTSNKKEITEGALNRWNNAAQTASQINSKSGNTITSSSKLGGKLLPGQRIALAVQQRAEYEKQFYINDTIYKKEQLGEYKTFEQMKKIYALTDNSKQAYAFLVEPIRIFAPWGGKDGLVKIANSPTLYTTLQKLLAKYKEWQKTAISNNVGAFEKEIDIEIPIETMTFYRGKEIHAGKWDNKKFTFIYKNAPKPPVLTCTGTWKGMNDDTAQLTIAFKNEQELCDFIAFFNPKELKKMIDFQKQGGLFH